MTDRQLMQQALEALEVATTPLAKDRQEVLRAQAALRDRLAQPNDFNPDWDAMAVMVEEQQRMAKRIAELEAQPEPEPVAWMHPDWQTYTRAPAVSITPKEGWHPLYTAPRQWQGLTEIEFRMLYVNTPDYKTLWEAIEANLRNKNQ